MKTLQKRNFGWSYSYLKYEIKWNIIIQTSSDISSHFYTNRTFIFFGLISLLMDTWYVGTNENTGRYLAATLIERLILNILKLNWCLLQTVHTDLKVITKSIISTHFYFDHYCNKSVLLEKYFVKTENNSHISTHLHKNLDLLTLLSQKFREIVLLLKMLLNSWFREKFEGPSFCFSLLQFHGKTSKTANIFPSDQNRI